MGALVFGAQLLFAGAAQAATSALGVALISGGVTLSQQRQQRKATERAGGATRLQAGALNKQVAEQRKLSQLKNLRARRQTIRASRIKRAEVVSQAETTRTGAGSALAGEVSSVGSQLGFNLSFLDTAQGFQEAAVGFGQEAAMFGGAANVATGQANIFGTRAKIGANLFERAGGFKTIFKG